MPHLRFYLLGPLQFQRADQPVDFSIRKMQALLAYLAVTAAAQSRDHLLGLLWPESHAEAARKNLRNGLWQVGRTLGDDVVLATSDTLALADDVWCDVAEFAALMRGDTRPNADLDTQMEEATRLWRGPLLAGIRLVDAPEFELWLRNQRTLFEQVYLSGLSTLVADRQAYARWQEVISPAQQILHVDETQESAHAALMEAYAQLGQRSAALRQYEQLASTLRRELATEPLAATQALHARIMHGELTTVETPTPAHSVAPIRHKRSSLPFVGRTHETAQLNEALHEAEHGPAQIVLLSGELGIGKSTLWQHWAQKVEATKTVLTTRCLEATRGLPFAPLATLFSTQGHLERITHANSPVAALWLTELSRLIPQIRVLRPSLPNAIPLPPEEEHRRLFEAFVQCLRALAAQPLILFFDDLHWADHATLDWLGYLADQMRDEPLLLVVAYRTHEAPPELVNYTASWGRDHHLRRLNLEPLTHAETAALVAALAVDTSMADYLHNQSGGNPYYLTELSRIHPDGRPAALQELLAARVRGLPEPAQRLLQAAAILEPTITLAILQEVSQLSEDAVLDALDALLEATVLKERGAQYEFAHPLVAGVVRDNLSHARRTRLHLRAAEALFAVHSDKVDASAGQLAHHYAEADQPAKAAHFADLAANHAAEMAAMAEAVNFYRLATMVEPTTARKLALGEALLHVPSHLQEARETIQAAFVDYEARQDQAGMVQAALHLAVSYLSTEEGEHILPWATRLQAAAASSDSIELEATAHYLLAAGKFHTPGRVPEADDHYRAATRLADNNRLVAEIGLQSWFGWGNYSVQLGDFWPAQMKFQRALEIAQSANNIYFQALSYNNLAYTRLLVDDILGAHSAIEAGLRFVEQHALMRPRQYLYSTRGELALADGALEEAESWFLRGQAEARIYDNQTQVANIHAHLGRVAHAQGDLARAEELLTTARASVSQVSAYFLQIQIELWLGTLYLDQGNPQATQAIIARTQKQLAHAERTALHAKLDALTKQMVEQ